MPTRDRQTLPLLAALGGLTATVVTSVSCVGPLVAIMLGVGGMGWLTHYAYLRLPASIATGALLALGFYIVYRRRAACAHTAKGRWSRATLWAALAFALAVHAFEYLILPNLG